MKIGVIGNGFVGSAIANGFSNYEVKVFDKNPDVSQNTLEDTLSQDFVFISVPTPMIDAMGADCNLSIIESCFDEIESIGSKAIFIIKSTVPIGTTKSLQSKHPSLNIVHSPNF